MLYNLYVGHFSAYQYATHFNRTIYLIEYISKLPNILGACLPANTEKIVELHLQ